MKKYAGIGSRKAGSLHTSIATTTAKYILNDYLLRSGGAAGMDTAFEIGAPYSEIFRANDATDNAIELASKFHPAWHKCNSHVRKLMGRNTQIILGKNLDDPVDFVLYWCPDETMGGTSHGLRVAREYNIPTYEIESWFSRETALLCNHANEVPNTCYCVDYCYCKFYTCK